MKRRCPSLKEYPAKPAKHAKAAPRKAKKPLSVDELHRQMMASGLIHTTSRILALDLNDDDPEDQPVIIKGEPLSETIIRERR